MSTASLNIQIDSDLKRQSEEIFNELGLTMSSALTIFLRRTVNNRGIPFELKFDEPNKETLAVIQDVDFGQNMSKPFNNVKELMEDLDADD
jgi:DNA-damage-inducible protein J